MNPTVYDFLELFTDPDMQPVAIYDLANDEEVFRGTRDDMPSELQDLEVQSIDLIGVEGAENIPTLNVDTAD